MDNYQKFNTLSEFHRAKGLPQPEHPLISLVDYGAMNHSERELKWIQKFYSIALKRNVVGKFRYGQLDYDFDEGLMSFFAPNQVFTIKIDQRFAQYKPSGWILLIHPDFLWNTVLAKKIQQYQFFNYSLNEALFLSEKEESIIEGILQNIQREYRSTIDDFSKNIMISQLELLLSYAERFYKRQFITREKHHHEILTRLEQLLADYFNDHALTTQGLPSVQFIAETLAISPNYLSSMLKHLTGQSTKQHIQNKVIEKAKEKLSTTQLSVSQIAYDLGFEHAQSFSKLFKKKTNLSPLAFRQSFN
ncbi:MAG: helix-turn-helix domain-containing protein [Flammeovirgaceae bacterium]